MMKIKKSRRISWEILFSLIEYSFFIRFIKEIPKEKITDFESQIRESLGHLKEVTDYLSMINEDEK